jgi:NSS family neurotransmitter:Na+ symporter
MMKERKNTGFNSKLGVILAAAGSAIGLGNIWKFPYEAGENGGGAFLLVYLLCVILFGLPLLMAELFIGRKAGQSTFSAFRAISGSNRWQWLGWWSALTVFVITVFYFVVTGWCVDYLYESVIYSYKGMGTDALLSYFTANISDTPKMLICALTPVLITAGILWFGVSSGIERLSKILMPFLLIMMTLMTIHVLLLEGSGTGLRFLFAPDFSQITPAVIMKAAGQCFFSLSVGLGLMITYGAYMPTDQDATKTALMVISLDTLVALLAGVIIFPAVFAFGFNPAEGPQLVFVVLPAVLQHMAFPWMSGVLFFLLLFIAALTSTISLMEVIVASVMELSHGKLNRHQSVLIAAAVVCTFVAVYILSMTGVWGALQLFGQNLFELSDTLVTTIMMPLGALAMSLFIGWFMPMQGKELVPYSETRYKLWLRPAFVFTLRWIVPISIILIFLNGVGILRL